MSLSDERIIRQRDLFWHWLNKKGNLKKELYRENGNFTRGYKLCIKECFKKLEEIKKKDMVLSDIFVSSSENLKFLKGENRDLRDTIVRQKKLLHEGINTLRNSMMRRNPNNKDLQEVFQDFLKFMSKHGFEWKHNSEDKQ